MTPLDAARLLVSGPCPTYWEWEYTGRVNAYGIQEGGNTLHCALCRQKLHAHLETCPWPHRQKIVAALEAE